MFEKLFGNILGGKEWYYSLTVWGLVVYTTGESVVNAICELDLVSQALCNNVLMPAVEKGWVVLGVLGIRRDQNRKTS